MRYGAVRALALGAVTLGAAGLLAGCGSFGGDNAEKVCGDTEKAFQQYVAQVRGVDANEPAQWGKVTERLAGRVDALAGEADGKKLKKALKDEAGRLRTAAASVGTGDAAQLNTVMSDTPQRIGKACSR
ncbi:MULTISPECIES: hypothetical protein [Actinomadura]|uniref:Small secreted protein n=1 Tax=Actinomadura yumaensis TaxID=111807 RepID=A0ABW2CIJ4_9ACTN|nr:hypothetical protein [Actinomadura sp. J1-007]MWK37210.1 hypothetical protein [Actinomadura sp. J1-007]